MVACHPNDGGDDDDDAGDDDSDDDRGDSNCRRRTTPTGDGDDLILTRLRNDDPRLALMLTTLKDNHSERDYLIVVEYLQQQSFGDPSPSHTVGRLYGVKPDTARQIYHRARKRMRQLAADDPALESLRDFWWLAA